MITALNPEIAGKIIENSDSYSKYYNDNYNKGGSPKGYDLEKIFSSPQEHIEDIFYLSKYYYNKYGIIMRVINIIRDFGVDGFKLNYPTKDKNIRKVIDDYNNRISVNQLLRDIIFEKALTGNCVCYDREGKRVDIYPIPRIEVLPLVWNNKSVLIYKNDFDLTTFGTLAPKSIIKKLELSYPKEVALGIKKNEPRILLEVENVYHLKTNNSRYEAYGLPFIITAFDELAHKTVLKEAERSTATGIIDKILKIGIGDKDYKPKQTDIDFYDNLFSNKKGSLKVTVPYFVNVEWIEPSTDIFGKDKFEQVDQDILNALGISLTLIRGEGGGNYSEGFIAVTGLIKTIEAIREDIPTLMDDLYRKELERNKINPDKAPKFQFNQVEIDKSAKFEMLQWLFTSAGLPYEILYNEVGHDFLSVKLSRESENERKMEDIFKIREQPFQGQGQNTGGAPKKSLTERKTDKNQSNNKSPRPSTSK